MKVTIKYEEAENKDLHMTLRLTLPLKYVNGPTSAVVKLFVDHYNKKHEAHPLDATTLHVKIVGGSHLKNDDDVSSTIRDKDECYLMGEEAYHAPAPPLPPSPAETATPSSASAPAKSGGPKKGSTDEQGRIRCKRFGCQKFYDPKGEPQECVHHKSAPIFHEVAKWWSCCQDRKAYDWDEFMRIPGCCKSFCTDSPEGQSQKRFMGGCDLRGDTAPVRLDADAPRDPRHKITDLRKGLIAIGVDGDLFDKVWQDLAAEINDPEEILAKFRSRFAGVLNAAGK